MLIYSTIPLKVRTNYDEKKKPQTKNIAGCLIKASPTNTLGSQSRWWEKLCEMESGWKKKAASEHEE